MPQHAADRASPRVCQSTGWPNTPESALLPNTTASISTLFFVLPILVRFLPTAWSVPAHGLVRFLPTAWSEPIDKYLPSNAGGASTHSHPDPTLLAPWTGLGLFFGYAVIGLS